MIRRFIASLVCFTFIFNNLQYVQAQDFSINQLPVPGTMVGISSPFAPLVLKGLIVNPQKPLEFQFIVDTGRGPQDTSAVKDQANQLVKYFLAGLTIPEGDLWVNLSPYEKNRMVPEALGQTELGRDLLAQDYILKQLTASLIYPEKDLGKEFWSRVYAKAQEQFGTTNIPVNTFNKVWILPNQAQVFEKGNAAYVTKATLKVMLDEDYLAKQKHQVTQASSISSQIVRQIILPEIEKEVNTDKNFATLRQIYQALILSKWYKETIQNGLLDAVYTNKNKVAGVNVNDPAVKEEIYQRYIKAYKKGAFNYIKEDPTLDGQVMPRKYFSGGITQMGTFSLMRTHDDAMLSESLEPGRGMFLLTVNCDAQNNLLRNSFPFVVPAPKPKTHPQQKQTVGNLRSISVIPNRMLSLKPSVKVERKFQELKSPSTIQPKRSFDFSKIIGATVKLYDHAMTSLGIAIGVIVSAVGYFIYKVVKKYFVQEKVTSRGIITIPSSAVNQNREQQIAAPQALTRPGFETQIITPSRPSRNYENTQPNTNLPLDFRHELENHIQQLGDAVDRGSREALIRNFRPVSPQELPMPMPLSMLDQDRTDRDKVIHILENLQMMLDGTTEKALHDFELAIDNSRDSVTRQALNHLDDLSDNELLGILTNGYVQKLGIEFNSILDNLTHQFHHVLSPSIYEQNLYVSDEINERYPRFPRYLKWLLTNNLSFENDYNLRQILDLIHKRTYDIPAFPDMIAGYSKAALIKSLYSNPELARRVLLFLARNASQQFRHAADSDVRREIQLELAHSLLDDPFIEGEIIPDEGETFPAALELEASPQIVALPAPGMDKTENHRAALKNLTDGYTQFMARYKEHLTAISKTEADLKELSEGLAEAKRENNRVIIDALQPAVEGLTSKLRKLNEKMPRLNQDKAKYEEQINTIRNELGPSEGTNLYSLDPMSTSVVAVFTVMFGIPLYITKKILNKWYNTTDGKTLGMAASMASLAAGYYLYLESLSPQIEKLLTDPSNADPWLATFFIIWPVAVLSGIWGGKVGKGFSHDTLYQKAKLSYTNEKYDEAISFLEQAIKLNSKNENDYTLLAESQWMKHSLSESIASYKKALEINPNNGGIYNNLGILYSESGDEEKGIESYKRSIELEANHPEAFANLGETLHKKGRLLEAARYLQRSQEIKPIASVTEELNQILRQTGEIQKSNKSVDLPFFKTMQEVVPWKNKWLKDWYSDSETWFQAGFWGGLLAGGAYLWGAYQWNWWQLGVENVTATRKWIAAISTLGGGVLLGLGLPYVVGKIADIYITTKQFFNFPSNYKKLQEVNKKSSDELSDRDLKAVAPIYASMSKEYLEIIFRSWAEAGQEEKIARLLKFGKWDSDKTRLYGDIGEYKRISRVAALKFATTVQGQQAIFDFIDKEKDMLAQKGITNAISLMKDILPQVTETPINKDGFFYWLSAVVNLPKNILDQGSRQVLAVFTDLREYERAREDSFTKFGPLSNSQASARVNVAIDGLKRRLEKDGINYAAILKKMLPDINKASRNVDEFIFWINEVMRFETQWFSSGIYMTVLQNLIGYKRAKEEASSKLCHTLQETTQLVQAVDGLLEELKSKQISGYAGILKDIVSRVTEVSRTLAEFLEYIAVLKSFDTNMWGGTRSVLQAFNNHVAYKQAREGAADKFTQNDTTRQKFLAGINNLRDQLVKKGFPQASDMLKDIIPELTKTCRTKEEFIYWLGELIGLNNSVWQRGALTVIKNFNDLAGFKMAKETVLDKLCANQQERDKLAQAIDALKAKLEEKLPSCAGLFKDVILEILKDINVLANPPNRLNDFKWYLGKTVDFETPTWAAGTTQVLSGYQEIKEYIIKKRALSAKFTTNQDEQKRLLASWGNIDKSPNFVKPSFISLLNNTLNKIANFAANPRDFVLWIVTLSELNKDILEVFCRDIDTVFAYYKEKGSSRDFDHFTSALNHFYKINHQIVLITPNLLDILTDPSLDSQKRAEKLAQNLMEQKIVQLGAPHNLVGVKDSVSVEELIRVIDKRNSKDREAELNGDVSGMSGEQTLRRFIQYYTPVKEAIQKMGREGVYSYYESQKPIYYRHFLEDATGLRPGFNRPGEKFRVSYSDKPISWSKQEESQALPITDDVQELKQFVRYLRADWPDFYNDLTKLRKNKIKEKPLEEKVTSDSIIVLAKQIYDEVLKSQFSDQQKIDFVTKIMEINAFQETADLRAKILKATNNEDRLRSISQYWEKVLDLIKQHKWIKKNSEIFVDISGKIKQRVVVINNQIGDGAKEIMQFYQSGGTLADFFKGWVSDDCTRFISGDHPHFLDTQAFVMDPAFFLFKVVEKNEWIGNVYSFLFKDKNGKFYLYVDMFQLDGSHPITKTDSDKQAHRIEFSSRFIRELSSYLGSIGVDYLLVSKSPAQRGIPGEIVTAIKRDYKIENTETVSLRKLGGTEFFSDAGVTEEYDYTMGQHISNNFQDVSGYKIQIDKTSSKILLEEMASEASRLADIIRVKQEGLNVINRKGFKAAASGKNVLALHLKEASEKETAEIKILMKKLNELQEKSGKMKGRVEQAARKDSAQLSIKKFAIGLALAATLFFTPQIAQAAHFTHNPNGTLQVTVEKNDTFGQIVLDSGYKGHLWGANGNVAKLSGNVESQLPSHNVDIIKPGEHFNIPSPEIQRTINGINEQTESVQADIDNLRQEDSNLKVQVGDLTAKLGQANKEIQQLKSNNKLPDEVAKLQNKKEEYERQVSNLRMKQSKTQDELNNLTAEKEKIKQEVLNLKKEGPAAQQSAEDLKGELSQLKTQITQLQNQTSELKSQKNALEGNIDQLSKDKQNLENQLSDLKKQISQTKNTLDHVNNKVSPTFSNIWASFSWWQKLGISLFALTGIGIIISVFIMWKRFKEREGMEERVADLKDQANDLEKRLEAIRQEKESLGQEIELKKEQINQEIANLTEQKNKLANEVSQLTGNIEIKKEVIRQEEEKIVRLKTEAAAYGETVETLKERSETFQVELKTLEQQKEEANKEFTLLKETLGAEKENFVEQIKIAEEDLKRITDGISALVAQKEQLEHDIADYQIQKDTLKEEIIAFNQKKDDLTHNISELEEQEGALIDKDFERAAQLKKKQIFQQIGELTRQKAEIQTQTQTLQDQFDARQQELAGILHEEEMKSASIREEIAQFEQELSILRQSKADLNTALLEYQQSIDQKKKELSDLVSARGQLQQEIQNLNNQKDSLTDSLGQNQQEIDKQGQRLKDIQSQIQTNEQALSDQKESIQYQIKALDQEFTKKKQEAQEALETLRRLDEERTNIKIELSSLQQQRDERNRQILSLSETINGLQIEKTEHEGTIQDLRRQAGSLIGEVEQLKEQKARLQNEVGALQSKKIADQVAGLKEEVKAVEKEAESIVPSPVEAEPAVDELVEQTRTVAVEAGVEPKVEAISEKPSSFNETVNDMLGHIAPQSNTGIYDAVINEIRNILGGLKFDIQEDNLSNGYDGKNIIVNIPATTGMEKKPKIFLNAHIDIHDHGYYYISPGSQKVQRSVTGALDDRVGVVAILGALNILKEKILRLGIPHGPIILIFTDKEEQGAKGGEDLANKYKNKEGKFKGLFDNTGIVFVVDGPLIWPPSRKLPEFLVYANDREHQLKNPFVVSKPSNIDQERLYKIFNDSVEKLHFKHFQKPQYAKEDGLGDHWKFAEITDYSLGRKLPVINLRCPHNAYHDENENVDVEYELVPVAQWLAEIVMGLIEENMSTINNTTVPDVKTSGITKKVAEGQKPVIIREFIVDSKWELSLLEGSTPASYGLTRILFQELSAAIKNVSKKDPFFYYDAWGSAFNKKITILQGYGRLASIDEKGNISIDLDAFESDSLLTLELEHEYLHQYFDKAKGWVGYGIKEIGSMPKAVEEILILLYEVIHFLTLNKQDQTQIIETLKRVDSLDSGGFVKILKKYSQDTDMTGLIEDLIYYVESSGAYSQDIVSYFNDKNISQIWDDIKFYFAKDSTESMFEHFVLDLLSLGDRSFDLLNRIALTRFVISKIGWNRYLTAVPEIINKLGDRAFDACLTLLQDKDERVRSIAIQHTYDWKEKLKQINYEYSRFMVTFREKETEVTKADADLQELSEALKKAKSDNDQVIIGVLQTRIDKLTPKLVQLVVEKSRLLDKEKVRYEEQISIIRSALGEAGGANSSKGKEIEALLERLGPQGNTGIHAAVVEEIKNILGDEKFQIQEDEFSSRFTGSGKNLIVTIPSTPGMENIPKIILNAHMDIYEHGFDYISSTGEKKRSVTGAMDDRAGAIAILSALNIINDRILKKNIPHGSIILIFTDKEERGAIGSGNIKIKYRNNKGAIKGLFDNTDIIIVVDGPLLSRKDKDKPNDHQRNNPFVISRLLNINEKSRIYKIIYDSVKLLNFKDYQEPRVPYADGVGDHWEFAEVFDKKLYRFVPVINLRAPYNDFDAQGKIVYHSPGEIADVENGLVPVAQWLAEIVTQFIKVNFAGSPKGIGMFTPDEHINVNAVISQAQREGRGELIWGNASGWRDDRAKFVNDIKGYIVNLRRYSSVTIPKLGRIDISNILSSSSIVLIVPRANAPPGLLVNNKNSYSVAHNGLAQNSIYIDQYSFNKFYSFEIAILLAHEAILLGAKRLAAQKGLPWTEKLAKEVVRLADEFEVQIVGKSNKGNGSRFDDRIQEILAFNLPEPKPVRPIINEPEIFEVKSEQSTATIPPTRPAYFSDPRISRSEPQVKSQVKSPEDNGKILLDSLDTKDDVLAGLRKLFLNSMLNSSTVNLPAKLHELPPKIANEINQAYALGKIDRVTLDPDYFVFLTVFFSRLFPNHSNSLINYLRNLDIQIIDTGSLTFGGTLDGHTFFIQRSVFEYLLKRQISVDEIMQGIKGRDMQILVALFRVIIHEIGAAFYKTSHEANQELEKLFLALLSKTSVTLPYKTQEEFRNINNTVDLNSLPRTDWAIDESLSLDQVVEIKFTMADMVGLFKEIDSKLINALYGPNQAFRNNAAQTLSMFRAVEGLPFLRELKEKEPGNRIVVQSITDLTNINAANNHLLKGGINLNQIAVKRAGHVIQIRFDPIQLNAIEQGGFEGFTPVITSIIPIRNLLPLLGVNTTKTLVKNSEMKNESGII
jgi:chromosome segregation ATPase/Zn-dependent M28 family amino/carboxypeptidase